jgi:hypothetical protein
MPGNVRRQTPEANPDQGLGGVLDLLGFLQNASNAADVLTKFFSRANSQGRWQL